MMPRWVDARRVTFKYGLGEKVISTLRTLHELGPLVDRAGAGRRRDGLAPRGGGGLPARPGHDRRRDDRGDLRGPVGAGTGKDGAPRQVYLYHVVDNAWSMSEYGCQAKKRGGGR